MLNRQEEALPPPVRHFRACALSPHTLGHTGLYFLSCVLMWTARVREVACSLGMRSKLLVTTVRNLAFLGLNTMGICGRTALWVRYGDA